MPSEFRRVNGPARRSQVYQGESEFSAQNTLVGEFALTGIERAKAGVPKFEIVMVRTPRWR